MHPLAQRLADLTGTGQRGGGHQQRQIGITVQQCANQRQGGAGFAHRHGVNPQAAGRRRRDESQSLAPTPAMSGIPTATPVQPQQRQRQDQIEQTGIDQAHEP